MPIEKAQESLRAAELCFGELLYNSTANRAYYAMFQAAVVALARAGVLPTGEGWSHDGLRSTVARVLIQQRKLYKKELATFLAEGLWIRNRADYRDQMISEQQARRMVQRACAWLAAVERG